MSDLRLKDESPYSTKTSGEPFVESNTGANQVNLVFILLLIMCVAIIASLVQLGFAEKQKTFWLVTQLAVGTGIASSFAGAVVGFCIERRFFAAFLGFFVGFVLGTIAGAISTIPNDYALRFKAIAFIGSLAMIWISLFASNQTTRIDGSRFKPLQEPESLL